MPTIRITDKAHKNLKIIAAVQGKKLVEVLDEILAGIAAKLVRKA